MINFGHSRSKFVFTGSVSRNMFSIPPCPRICSEIIGIFALQISSYCEGKPIPALTSEVMLLVVVRWWVNYYYMRMGNKLYLVARMW